MKIKILCTLLFSLCYTLSGAQNLRGTILEKNTQETIPFATVQLGENYGAISNSEGKFNIDTTQTRRSDSLKISSMGFETHQVSLKEFKDNDSIFLEPAINELAEVFLRDEELTADALIELFLKHKDSNYVSNANQLNVFQRTEYKTKFKDYGFELKKANYLSKATRKKINQDLEQLSHSVKGSTSLYYNERLINLYLGEADSLKLVPQKAIKIVSSDADIDIEKVQNQAFKKIFEKLKDANSFKVRTFIFKVEDSLDLSKINKSLERKVDSLKTKETKKAYQNFLTQLSFRNKLFEPLSAPDDYQFEITDVTSFNGEIVYIISFEPDRNRAKYKGKLYMTAENYSIVRFERQLIEGKSDAKLNLKFLFGVKYDSYKKDLELMFFKNANGKYYPKYINMTEGQYFYVDRKFVFKENEDNRRERLKFKLNILAEVDNYTTNEFFVVSQQEIDENKFDSIEESDGIIIDEYKRYSPDIWKDYNVIEATEKLKNYK
ncbi:MAG: carboxypeptidase-like regulatory domain-containing protein [Psychroflexus sp.]|nr:carboxypeptidase-like regulatory domain-containing protein [Psychroflexus sp.]MDN6309533.1 carboxypeptidase-like regulatory domain-containing protein [Psychroflexus sp.]